MGTDDTSIRISRDTWQELHDRKEPGQSHDDVIQGLLDQAEPATSNDDALAES